MLREEASASRQYCAAQGPLARGAGEIVPMCRTSESSRVDTTTAAPAACSGPAREWADSSQI